MTAGSGLAAGRPVGVAAGLERGSRAEADNLPAQNQSAGGSRGDTGVGGAPATPTRAAIATADGGGSAGGSAGLDNGRAEILADAGGGSTAEGRGSEGGDADDTTARVGPQPQSLASRGSLASRSSRGLDDARGGLANAESEADDALSADGMIAGAPTLAMTSAGSRRGLSPAAAAAPLAPAAALPRACSKAGPS